MNDNKFPAAVAVGYSSIFITLFLFSLVFSGWLSTADQEFIPTLLSFNTLLIVSGIFSLFNSDKLESMLFLSLGTFWTSFLLRFLWFPTLAANKNFAVFDGWAVFAIAVIFFFLWLSAFKGNKVRSFFLLGLWLSMVCGAIANWFSIIFFMSLFGYLGLITAILSGIYAVSMIVDFAKFKKT